MRPLVVAFLGVGSLRVGPPALASFANYFGERDIELRLFDPEPEMVDLFDRLARSMFLAEQSMHDLLSGGDLSEVLEGADAAVVADEARLLERLGGRDAIAGCLAGREALWLPIDGWPPEHARNPTSEAHRILRWIRGDDYLAPFLAEHRRTAISAWLDDIIAQQA